ARRRQKLLRNLLQSIIQRPAVGQFERLNGRRGRKTSRNHLLAIGPIQREHQRISALKRSADVTGLCGGGRGGSHGRTKINWLVREILATNRRQRWPFIDRSQLAGQFHGWE